MNHDILGSADVDTIARINRLADERRRLLAVESNRLSLAVRTVRLNEIDEALDQLWNQRRQELVAKPEDQLLVNQSPVNDLRSTLDEQMAPAAND